MAKRKPKKGDFDPNPYEGFRATTREANGRVEVYLSMTGNEGTVADVLIGTYQGDLAGIGRADVVFAIVQVMAIALNAGLSSEELGDVWSSILVTAQKYSVAIPDGWTCLTVSGLDLSDHQVLYVREATQEVVVVEPDTGSMLTTLKDLVFQGRQNIVASGRGGETPKIQSQPDSGKEKGGQGRQGTP